jgi:3-phenylpropionate/trans-cinnamate dioxygenase ferredoxin reductase subunit
VRALAGIGESAQARIVIVGAGQAGAQVCASLRAGGHTGPITMIGDEASPPYQRPPLSKGFLKGELAADRLWLRPLSWYQDQGVDLMLSARALRIDRSARVVELEYGARVPYDWLVLATGSRPRMLPDPDAEVEGVHALRTLEDVSRLRGRMVAGRRLVVIGGGYIGLEGAAVARQMGLHVALIEAAPRLLARVAGPVLAEFFAREHRAQGVDVRTGVGVAGIVEDGRGLVVYQTDGRALPCDLVLVGIGIVPNEELARDAGLTCGARPGAGITTDRDGRTSDANIFACGDCARRPLVHSGRLGRLESVHNAIEQGKLVAAAILGLARPTEDVPWFWSDQYDLKLQIAGLSEGYDTQAVRGDPGSRSFAVFYQRRGQVIAVDAVNDPAAFMTAKRLIARGVTLAPDALSDTSQDLKQLAAQAA